MNEAWAGCPGHWYDLALLADHRIGARALGVDRGLLKAVVAHKRVFYAAGYADYDACLDGRMRLVPMGPLLEGLQADYRGMQDMIYGTLMPFDAVMQKLNSLAARINGLAKE